MTSESIVPEGFLPYSESSPFLDRIGPLYERDDANGFALGLFVLDQHDMLSVYPAAYPRRISEVIANG